MSSLSKVRAVRIENILPHPNADAIEIAQIEGFPSIVKKGEYKPNDIVGFVPPDMLVDTTLPEFAFLGDRKRVRSIKLRGIVSYGLVFKAREGWVEDQDVTEEMNCKVYEAPESGGGTNTYAKAAKSPKQGICYTDIESARKYANRVFEAGEEVIITEKIHGCFSSDTKVMLVNGEEIPISEIKINDIVLSYKDDEFIGSKVLDTKDNGYTEEWLELEFDNGRKVTCTPEHLFLTENRGYVEAQLLTDQDKLISFT